MSLSSTIPRPAPDDTPVGEADQSVEELLHGLAGAPWVDQREKLDVSSILGPCEAGLGAALEELAARDPTRFCAGALHLIRTRTDFPGRSRLVRFLLTSDLLLAPLCDPLSFSRAKALALAERLGRVKPRLAETILARMSEPPADAGALSDLAAERALEIATAVSEPARLMPRLPPLLRHPNVRIRSKAALLYVRGRKDPQWVGQHMMMEPDARVRANLVEGLWGVDTDEACAVMWDAVGDASNRVVANALVGLHRLGEPEAWLLLRRLAAHPTPVFRASAAWAMRETGDPSYAGDLARLAQDPDRMVRRMAQRAPLRAPRAAPASQPCRGPD